MVEGARAHAREESGAAVTSRLGLVGFDVVVVGAWYDADLSSGTSDSRDQSWHRWFTGVESSPTQQPCTLYFYSYEPCMPTLPAMVLR